MKNIRRVVITAVVSAGILIATAATALADPLMHLHG